MSKIGFYKSELRIFRRSGSGTGNNGYRQRVNTGRARFAIAGLVLCTAVLIGQATLAATEPDERDSAVGSAISPHEPLAGQPCHECHESSVPLTGRCLLAGDQMCILCHDIPASGGQAVLVEPSGALCFKCHAQTALDGDFAHGSFAAGSCLACHSPHGDDGTAMLRIAGRQMCLTCHDEMEADLANARFRHNAIANGCTDCHSPHASDQRYQLRKPVPDVCEQCHDDIFEKLEKASVTHSPAKDESACLSCHKPHMAEYDRLLSGQEMDLCLKCHNEPIKVEQYELQLMGSFLAEHPMHHGPIKLGECSECHNPHGSPYFRLLNDAYPESPYAPFLDSNYALCFRCHDSTLASEERTESLTDFRDGPRNLHFVHVNKTETGRTCRLCHDAHASSLPKYIPESVAYGTWDLPIKYKTAGNGGSCEPGCHAAQSYDRLAPQ